jgi:hypothetical protein
MMILTDTCSPRVASTKGKLGVLQNKDIIVRHLCLLFACIPEVVINDYGLVRDWFREASHEQYWEQLVEYLLAPSAPIPTHPTNWPPLRRRSPHNHTSNPPSQEPGKSDKHQRQSLKDSPPVPPPPRQRPPPHHHDHPPPPPLPPTQGQL